MFSRSSNFEIYINQECIESKSLRYPRSAAEGLTFTVGFSPISEATAFRGQLGPIIVLSDILEQKHATALYKMGSSFDGDLLPCDQTGKQDYLRSLTTFTTNNR